MEEASQYEEFTKEELIQIIMDLKKEIEGTIGQIGQQVDIPPITPLTTEYQQVIKVCACGHCNCPSLPIQGYTTIGPRMGALITYLNVEHALPYDRLSQITHDLLGFAISEGTVANKLTQMQEQAKGLIERIKQHVISAPWIGSDETRTSVVCHAHLLRNLQYAVDAERSRWAYHVQRLLRKSHRAPLTQTLRKQKLPILATLTAILQGNEGAISLQSA